MTVNTLLHKVFGTTPNDGNMQPKEALAYSVTGIGQNFICTIIGSYLTIFMTDALLMADATFGKVSGATAVALLMLFTRLFDAFNDPIMGSIVDRTRTKWGKCRPFLKWMAIPIGLVTIACFLPVYNGTARSFIIISVLYVIWSMVYTVADVPYWGLSTAMTNNTTIRGNLLTVARLCCIIGAGIVTIFVPVITTAVTAKYKDPESGVLLASMSEENAVSLKWTYFLCAIVLVVLSVPMFFYGFKNTKERYTATGEPPTLAHNLRLLFKNDQLLLILISGVLGAARTVYMYTGSLYFAKYVLGKEAVYSVLTLLVVPGGAIATVLIPWCTKKFGKKKTYIYVHAIGAVTMFAMYFIGRNGGYRNSTVLLILAIGFVILGLPQGINNVITYAMIGDTVEYLEWKTGERAEGICFSMQTFINKIAMAVGAFIGVMAYGITGISPSDPYNTVTAEGSEKLWAALILSGAVSMLLTIIPMLFYKITENRQREMVTEIEARKAKESVK